MSQIFAHCGGSARGGIALVKVPNFGSVNRRIMGRCVLIGTVNRLVEDLEARQERWAVIS